MAEAEAPSARTAVKRLPARGHYDADTVHAILDEALFCHVGLVDPAGHPVVLPTIHVRRGDQLYLHGSPASHLLRTAKDGVDVCVTVTLLDGLVLAKSTFHHSMNYRSVVVMGRAEPVLDPVEKARALGVLVEHIVPGRTADAREPTEQELKGTLVLRLPITEASVKRRTGGPVEDPADDDLAVWSGVVPLRVVAGAAEAEPGNPIRDAPGYV